MAPSRLVVPFALALVAAGCVAAPAPPVEDAWAGASALVLVEGDVEVAASIAAGADRCLPRCAGAVLTPGARLVPPDAARVVVEARWEGDAEALRLVFDHGASRVAERAIVRNGAPFVVELAPGMADAAGQRHSHWWLGFFALAEPAGAVAPFTASVRVTAERGGSASPPAAPTWTTDGVMVLVEDARLVNAGVRSPAAGFCPACSTWTSAHPGGIVASDASRVRVTVSWEGPDAIAAGAWVPPETFVELELVEERAGPTGGERIYEAAVDPALADAASQSKSLWWFFGASQLPGGTVPSFTLRAEAVR